MRGAGQGHLAGEGDAVAEAADGIYGEIALGILLLSQLAQLFVEGVEHANLAHDVLIAPAGEEDASLLGDVDDMALFVDGVIELRIDDHHLLVDLVLSLHPLDQLFDPEFGGEQFEELTVLGVAALDAQQGHARLILVAFEQGLALAQQLGDQVHLAAVEVGDDRLEFVIDIAGRPDRAGDDQRGAGFVDEDAVDFVDDGIVEPALNDIPDISSHVVAQIVEAELIVGAVGYIGIVGITPFFGGHLAMQGGGGEAEKGVDFAHPFTVALGQIVVDRHQMGPLAGEGIEIEGHGGDQGLALAGGHLGDLALMEDGSAEDLHVVGDHVPGDLLAPHQPFLADQAAAGLLDHAVGFGEDVIQGFAGIEPVLELMGLGLEFVIAEFFVLGGEGVDLIDDRVEAPDLLLIAGPADQFGKNIGN
ncbi:MAG: hypothetical protein BWY77_00236 [bacterium ADurb.Bin431]|nr:MAG: hypothetical protein BWY77_00236 [bacterium ADurb.Bin431]